MKNIKFRAWDKEANIMVYSDHRTRKLYDVYYGFEMNGEGELECRWEGEFTESQVLNGGILDNIMQSTGLKDKNGVEIYENDLLKCTSKIYTNLGATRTGEYEETIKQVIWKDDSWGTRVISSNLTSKGSEKSGLVISAKYAEVIGDIYQNKEELEWLL